MGATAGLARFVVETRPEQVPDDVLRHGKRCVINMLGAALHASRDPALRILLGLLDQEGGRRSASVLGDGRATSLQNAALVNGFLAHLDDYDDTFFPTVLHPSAPTVPAALALAERERSSGRDFLLACVLGLEASCRVALAVERIRHAAGWHMTGTVGVFGAAAAAGRLAGLDAGGMARAFGLAGTQASGLRETFGTMTKAFHPARAAQSGLLAVLLTQRGFTCTETILEGRHGFAAVLSPDGHDLDRVTDGLLKRWEVMANAPKPYACGILSHSLIDAMLAFRTRPGVAPTAVRRMEGRVNPLVLKLEDRPEPTTGLEGRLSFQHGAAVALTDGAAFPSQFTDARVNDPTVAALRRTIKVDGDESIAQDQCDLTLTLADGRTYRERVEHATGTPDNPMTDRQIEDKFRALAGSVLPKRRVERLLATLWRLEEIEDIREVVRLCRAPRTPPSECTP